MDKKSSCICKDCPIRIDCAWGRDAKLMPEIKIGPTEKPPKSLAYRIGELTVYLLLMSILICVFSLVFKFVEWLL